MTEFVVLVDENDKQIGTEEKLKAHQDGGKLHRAISILLFNKDGQLLLQRRALSKYHAPGKWANTCCSHPRENEPVEEAAFRRLKEEMGFENTMEKVFEIIYKADVGNDLTEWEYDHIFFGMYNGNPIMPNPEEVSEYEWKTIEDIKEDIKNNPEKYAPWFVEILKKIEETKEKIPDKYQNFL